MAAFEGTVDVDLIALLQLLNLDRRSARVSVRRDEERGEIWVEDGQIIHASLGEVEGRAAFAEIATWTRGRYQMGSARAPPRKTIDGRFEFLVLDAMATRDEQERDQREASGSTPQESSAASKPVRVRPTFQRSAGGRKPEGSR